MNIVWEFKNKTNSRQSCPPLLGEERVWNCSGFFSLLNRQQNTEGKQVRSCASFLTLSPKLMDFLNIFIVNEIIFTVLLDYSLHS